MRANAITPRLIWVSDYSLFGASVALHAIVPLVDLKVELNGQSQSKQGLGDIIFGPALGFHHSEKFHSILALDMIAPSGRYDRDDLANTGRNYWVIEPVYAMSYIDPNGLNLDAKLMYDFNRENPATDYRSGQEFHVDYALGWGLGNGWVVGVGGHAYQHVSDDQCSAAHCAAAAVVDAADGNRGRSFSIGPAVQYASQGGWLFSAKWQDESGVRNRADGQAYWLKFTLPL